MRLREDPCPVFQISLAQGVSDGREVWVGEGEVQGLNKWLGWRRLQKGCALFL